MRTVFKDLPTDSKLIGRRFGKLTVVRIAGRGKSGRLHFDCICDCGKEALFIEGCSLYQRKSCGCLMARAPGEVALHQLWIHYRKGAKSRNYEWSLTKDEFRALTKQACFFCGREPFAIYRQTNITDTYIYSGVDRIDNSIGYVPENSVACCTMCNRAKGTLSKDDFIDMAIRIANKWD